VETPVTTELPQRLPVMKAEMAIWRAFLADEIEAIGARRHLGTTLSWISREPPVTVTAWVAAAIDAAARSLGIEPLKIPSGAGHDASHMARLGPMGMVFVPSRAGRSHCPEEWTDLEDICRGIAVLAESLVVCDQREEERRGRRRSGLHD